jgi:two-component system, chemotaxis family, chemotaxis protein CheY
MNDPSEPVIALVDDDAIFQLTASRMLRSTQLTHTILQFSNGEEARRYLSENADKKENLPDILFLDINMPYVDGWMFLEDYANLKKTLNKDILIYMVSSSIDPIDINRAKNNQSVKDYLIKPISRAGFEELLQRFKNRSTN